MDEREQQTLAMVARQEEAARKRRLDRFFEGEDLSLDHSWENKPEKGEVKKPVTHECANCGLTAHHAEMQEAERRCGTGYGEWYCTDGNGCQK
tara:strand:+ start:322 stop:600 length:279 start_codon:yes stop_codon:yes gene_type:complete